MPAALVKGRYRARLAEGAADLAAAQRLRHLCFVDRGGGARRPGGLDRDNHDALCRHGLVEDQDGRLVATFRLLALPDGRAIAQSYAAQYYDLTALAAFRAPMAELGRFCIHPEVRDPDVLRIAWGAVAGMVDDAGVQMMFGCSSFAGTGAERYRDAFALLSARHLAPWRWRPRVKAPDVVRFAARDDTPADARQALLRMPPLLRSYLAMGGWVSDHAVVDRDLNTLHVFTGLEIRAIPAARVRALRAVAGGQGVEPGALRV